MPVRHFENSSLILWWEYLRSDELIITNKTTETKQDLGEKTKQQQKYLVNKSCLNTNFNTNYLGHSVWLKNSITLLQ